MANKLCAGEETIEVYVLGRLEGPQVSAFEEHLLLCGICQDQVERFEEFVHALSLAVAMEEAPSVMQEKRRETRSSTTGEVEVIPGPKDRVTCATVDRSSQGLGILSPIRFPTGSRVKVNLDGRLIGAVVRHCLAQDAAANTFRVGLRLS